MMTSLATSMPPPVDSGGVFRLLTLLADPVASQAYLGAIKRSTEETRAAIQATRHETEIETIAARRAALELRAAQAKVVEERNTAEHARLDALQAEYDDQVRRLKALASEGQAA